MHAPNTSSSPKGCSVFCSPYYRSYTPVNYFGHEKSPFSNKKYIVTWLKTIVTIVFFFFGVLMSFEGFSPPPGKTNIEPETDGFLKMIFLRYSQVPAVHLRIMIRLGEVDGSGPVLAGRRKQKG